MTKPKWTPAKIKLGEMRAWSDNPRYSTKAQAERLIASEKKFGQPLPFLLAPKEDGHYPLLDGHQRLAAWLTVYGAEREVDAMVADRPLTDEEHRELIITLHTGATGQWDWDKLASWEVADLKEWGMDAATLKEWNTDSNNLKEMLRSDVGGEDTEPEVDRAAELLEKWQVKPGDLFGMGAYYVCPKCGKVHWE